MPAPRLLLYLIPALGLGGIAAGLYLALAPPSVARPDAIQVTVHCEVRLRAPIETIVARFQRRTDLRVVALFEEPEALVDQILRTGRGEVLVCTSESFIQEARQASLIDTVYLLEAGPAEPTGAVQPLGEFAGVTVAVLTTARAPESARALAQFIAGPSGQAVFRAYPVENEAM
jgi:ABC-type molybdate transport system substrate-binding protein